MVGNVVRRAEAWTQAGPTTGTRLALPQGDALTQWLVTDDGMSATDSEINALRKIGSVASRSGRQRTAETWRRMLSAIGGDLNSRIAE